MQLSCFPTELYSLDMGPLKPHWTSISISHSVVSDSLWPYGLQPSRLLCPWGSPGGNTGVGCHALLQGFFPQGLNLSLLHWAELVAQSVKNLPAVQETRVRSPGWEDPLEKEMATHSSILAWKICSPWDRKESGMTERLTLTYLLLITGRFFTVWAGKKPNSNKLLG